MDPISILEAGMVTSVGFTAAATCAAMRVGITGFVETRFMFAGEWLYGSPVSFEVPWCGREKLLQMVVAAIKECIDDLPSFPARAVPLLLCVAEKTRAGRLAELDESLLEDVQKRLAIHFHESSAVLTEGRIGGVHGLERASTLIAQGRPYCVIAGADTYLVAETLAVMNQKRRLLTKDNSDGFIAGEAAAAILVGPQVKTPDRQLVCLGLGTGFEKATVDSEEPLRAEGLTQAIKAALGDSGKTFKELDYRITDNSGEQYGFKEAALAITRLLRERKEEFDIWHPADCIGEVGAATVPLVLGVALIAARKGYAPGQGVLCHFSADGELRAAMVLRADSGGD